MPTNRIERFLGNENMKFSPKSIREEDRSVEIVLATETPIFIDDHKFGKVWEIMDVGGAIWESDSIPFLDYHARDESGRAKYSSDKVLGSVREIEKTIDEKLGPIIIARVYFADDAKSIENWGKVRDLHVRAVSVGGEYSADEEDNEFIPAGQKIIRNGIEYDGPIVIRKEMVD